ncbi:hypothetical protein AADZ90_002345 [Aestuariibius sp. 2305UL40-4]|uniref:hypothetical protein n=1 Tax=Aestuariibius violaceus TaxID=3234132 RepID=UPI00345EC907
MVREIDITDLTAAAKAARDAIRDFADLTRALFEQSGDPEDGPYLAKVLRREEDDVRTLVKELDYLADMPAEKARALPLDLARKRALARRSSVPSEEARIFDPDEMHAAEVLSGLEEAVASGDLTAAEADRFRAAQRRIMAAHPALKREIEATILRLDEPPDSGPAPPEPHTVSATAEMSNPKEPPMPQDSNDNGTLQDLVDSVSRLQGSIGGTGTGTGFESSATGAFSAFDRALGQRLSVVLGVPDLASDSARSLEPDDLLTKLETGLNRSVISEIEGGETRFRFNPVRAQGSFLGGSSVALGSQRIIQQTLRDLRGPFLSAVRSMENETALPEQDEADDLRLAVERAYDELIGEAGAATGVYLPRVDMLIRQMVFDVIRLAILYDVKDEFRHLYYLIDRIDAVFVSSGENQLAIWYEQSFLAKPADEAVDDLRDMREPPKRLRSQDISILVPEANDAALVIAIGFLQQVQELMSGDSGLSGMIGQIRALNDALASNLVRIRPALDAAGLSGPDSATVFLNPGEDYPNGIDLGRLLSWIEASCISDRTTLTRPDLNRSDIGRMYAARRSQLDAISAIRDEAFATIPSNEFSLGRREIREIRRQLDQIVTQLEAILDLSGRTGRTVQGD